MSIHTTDTGRPETTDGDRVLLFDMDGVILEGRGTDEIVSR